MNVISNACGLKCMWSQMHVVSNACGLKCMWSQMHVGKRLRSRHCESCARTEFSLYIGRHVVRFTLVN